MGSPELNIVTGAFSFTGKYVTRRLLAMGKTVRTLTNHPQAGPNPLGDKVSVVPYAFGDVSELEKSLRGATTIYNTYWVRFPYGEMTYDKAVENTKILIKAAGDAGIKRFVHISITHASVESRLPYFRGKGILEKAIAESKMSHAVIRPTVIFGNEGILINNIAWFLRHFPAFAVPGSGDYRLQPIFVEDLADIMVAAGQRPDSVTIDAAGPETFTFNELVNLIKKSIGSRSLVLHLPPTIARAMSGILGYFVSDVVLTQDEVEGLMANLLISSQPPAGKTRLSDWLPRNADTIGTSYASELRRHYR